MDPVLSGGGGCALLQWQRQVEGLRPRMRPGLGKTPQSVTVLSGASAGRGRLSGSSRAVRPSEPKTTTTCELVTVSRGGRLSFPGREGATQGPSGGRGMEGKGRQGPSLWFNRKVGEKQGGWAWGWFGEPSRLQGVGCPQGSGTGPGMVRTGQAA